MEPKKVASSGEIQNKKEKNLKIIQWEDYEQELVRLCSLTSALNEAKEKKELVQQKLQSFIQVKFWAFFFLIVLVSRISLLFYIVCLLLKCIVSVFLFITSSSRSFVKWYLLLVVGGRYPVELIEVREAGPITRVIKKSSTLLLVIYCALVTPLVVLLL